MVQRLRRPHTVRPEQKVEPELADDRCNLWSRDAMRNMNQKFVEQVERALRQERRGKAPRQGGRLGK
jgi:hypothetical protein